HKLGVTGVLILVEQDHREGLTLRFADLRELFGDPGGQLGPFGEVDDLVAPLRSRKSSTIGSRATRASCTASAVATSAERCPFVRCFSARGMFWSCVLSAAVNARISSGSTR